ncbi:sugar ABC transporter ATP-binding protein [Longivirga aurantiaca]|uniref:Sugar ABC transporter ATP-binding protein n=1 Tax=Longivirga aurantiaca TaxID=1837743 RepID=A0ABW1T5C8_9ACTN
MTSSTASRSARPVRDDSAVPVVSLRGVTKTFAGTRALRRVDLDFFPGEIHAVCGENGSGKSTMIKILSGVYQGDPGGTVSLNGEEYDADRVTPTVANRQGVRVVHQDLAVFPELTVEENLAIDGGFHTSKLGRIRWRKQHKSAEQLIRDFKIPARPKSTLAELSLAARTEVAIARSLRDMDDRGKGLLILDEPTAALPVKEVDALLASLRDLADSGQSILYVSHRLDEVLALADYVSVLRDGELVGTFPTSELDEAQLVDLMLGRAVHKALEHVPVVPDGDAVFKVENLSVGPLKSVSLEVHAGEMLGIAGVMGSGRSTLLKSIFGVAQPRAGRFVLDGQTMAADSPKSAMGAGIAMVPEHRLRDAAFGNEPVDMNISISVIGKYWRKLVLADKALRQDADQLISEYRVKVPTGRSLMSSLSGGNQQKVVVARWLRRKPRLILLDEPTQGVDVGARAEIYNILRRATQDGAAAVLVASDFQELAQVVDRAIVLRNGRVVAELRGDEITAHRLARLSHADEAPAAAMPTPDSDSSVASAEKG